MTYHLGADYFEDPDGTFVSQPKKYIDKLADTYKRLFNEDPPKGYKTPLDKNDHPELDTSEMKAPNLKCYEYIAVYVDDLCIAAESPSAIIQIFVKVPFKSQRRW